MTLPTTDTIVLYPAGTLVSEAIVLHRQSLTDGRTGLVLDRTAVHPVDAAWPDQPADRASIRLVDAAGGATPIADTVVGATDGSALFVGSEVPVKKGTDGWAFVAVHLVADDTTISEGDAVIVEVDPEYRRALSAGHTACHLASLALNRALADAWRKDVSTDAAGAPNFDALAIETSTIVPDGSVDVYRIGKSLRRKGFDPESLTDLDDLARRVNETVTVWVDSGAPARIDRVGELLTDRREWVCELTDGRIAIPCGGTHIGSLGAFSAIEVRFESSTTDGASVLTMTTTGIPIR
ncbi:metal-dependent hydrolase [Labedella phragmitis]|uniref:Metal-dependent hydrolase n=1 Tax=Labedella phragmitis TaxID=2498849 RepID=A0A3S4A6K5_9MICO|nr:metal-dependent hydrolase [Labedella phragmitis]RWZ52658.1 metal-dependent hydrolase [Labedella phragmitis]